MNVLILLKNIVLTTILISLYYLLLIFLSEDKINHDVWYYYERIVGSLIALYVFLKTLYEWKCHQKK